MRPNGGGFQLFLSDEMGIETRHTPEHGVDGAGVEASYLEVVEEALDVGALHLQQAGWPVAIPAVHEGFQRPAGGLQGGRLTIAALDRLQPSYHERLIRCSPVRASVLARTGRLTRWYPRAVASRPPFRSESHRVCAEDTRGENSIKIVRTVPESATQAWRASSLR